MYFMTTIHVSVFSDKVWHIYGWNPCHLYAAVNLPGIDNPPPFQLSLICNLLYETFFGGGEGESKASWGCKKGFYWTAPPRTNPLPRLQNLLLPDNKSCKKSQNISYSKLFLRLKVATLISDWWKRHSTFLGYSLQLFHFFCTLTNWRLAPNPSCKTLLPWPPIWTDVVCELGWWQ